jgi:hypothetical protein
MTRGRQEGKRQERKRNVLALVLAVAVLLVGAHATPAVGGGALAGLVGLGGPLLLASMLACGTCVGVVSGAVVSETWVALLADPGAWSWTAACAGACATALGIQ